jgi:hypothetical protein
VSIPNWRLLEIFWRFEGSVYMVRSELENIDWRIVRNLLKSSDESSERASDPNWERKKRLQKLLQFDSP